MNSIDLTPTWEAAAQIYISVLMNPSASDEATASAQEELIRMARIVDRLKAEQEAEA
tara:strand:- start:321 stop:491 length:171 start_codon:yes stop_codon:yes gene_type:complete